MKKLMMGGAIMFALSSCGGGWSSAEKEQFLKSCTTSATGTIAAGKEKAYCECMAEKLEKKYPKATEVGNLTATDMQTMAADCNK